MIPGETVLSQKSLGMTINKHTGDFKVIRSQGSGLYYVGTMLVCCGDKTCAECADYSDPIREKGSELDYNSRETDYFKTKQEAESALVVFQDTGVLPNMRF